MTDAPLFLAKVEMPEKGVFAVRCPQTGLAKGQEVVVNLGYGIDLGTLLGIEAYDPAVHGPSVPGYLLVRAKTEDDARMAEANATAARAFRKTFLEMAQEAVPDVRVPYARLSLGRQRFFVWYVCPSRRCDLASVAKAFGQRQKLQVFARQLGPRDEVGMVGAIGPCGRPCCCATWQTRYPSGLTPERVRECTSAQPNGICGRYKCCLAFED
jgi:cell fate regulator YaaT (PSP1 superfamily)